MRFRPLKDLCIVASLLLCVVEASAQGNTSNTHAGGGDQTLQTFRVGAEFYVRALAVDQRRNSLWVGTSIGALEIDLDSTDVKNSFTRKDGLANEYVFAIGVDPAGPVWFGTNAGGASKYLDGKWTTYFPMHGLADYWVYAFTFDSAGNTWIGTWDGINYYDRKQDRFITYREELINIWVYGIDIDAQGRVWIGTEGGVSMVDNGKWSSWTHEQGLGAPNRLELPRSANTGLGTRSRHDLEINVGSQVTFNPDYVFAVKTDPGGRGVWFGTWGGGASLFDGKQTWQSYTTADGLAGNVVYSIGASPDGVLWFGTNRGVSRFDGQNWQTYDRRHGLAGNHVYAITTSPNGDMWFGTKGGVSRLAAAGDKK
jgi:ligand-binding sensor domain-containing protein